MLVSLLIKLQYLFIFIFIKFSFCSLLLSFILKTRTCSLIFIANNSDQLSRRNLASQLWPIKYLVVLKIQN